MGDLAVTAANEQFYNSIPFAFMVGGQGEGHLSKSIVLITFNLSTASELCFSNILGNERSLDMLHDFDPKLQVQCTFFKVC